MLMVLCNWVCMGWGEGSRNTLNDDVGKTLKVTRPAPQSLKLWYHCKGVNNGNVSCKTKSSIIVIILENTFSIHTIIFYNTKSIAKHMHQ